MAETDAEQLLRKEARGTSGLFWPALVSLLVGGVVLGLLVGDGDLSDPGLRDAFVGLRAWRLANTILAGAALAVGGVLVQGLFRNPLASPSILGSTAGASLGGIAVLLVGELIFLGGVLPGLPRELLVPVGCLLGALFSLLVLLFVARRSPGIVTVLLTGFILSSFFLSIAGLLSSLAQERWEVGRAVVAFSLGGIESKGARHFALALPMVAVAAVVAFGWARHLDLLLSGEDEAAALGVPVGQVRRWAIVWTATLTGAAVAIGGNIGFVGLVVPHALRPFVGAEHRRLIPAALVGGATFLVWADVLARSIPGVSQVPLGVVTGLIGAPVFLVLLVRSYRAGEVF